MDELAWSQEDDFYTASDDIAGGFRRGYTPARAVHVKSTKGYRPSSRPLSDVDAEWALEKDYYRVPEDFTGRSHRGFKSARAVRMKSA